MYNDISKEVYSWVKTIAFAIFAALIITNVVIVNAEVPSGSMENTIQTKDRLIAFRLAYMFEKPERFDIIVFRYPENETDLYVKRIIGLPGEKVEIRDGKVYINDSNKPLIDTFTKEESGGNHGPYIVPEEKYFVLGDNRNDSRDSRYWENRFVARDKILGKAIFRYFPNVSSFKNYKSE